VKGYVDETGTVSPYTTFAQAFEHATGRDPFRLPQSWVHANDQGSIALSTPFNLSTTNDIIGGNSGSPVFDSKRRIVGLIFDGNIHSMGGNYSYDATLNRAIAIDSRAILEALRSVYFADTIVRELMDGSRPQH
jgi:hypothetical protein